jgi:ATPase related to the helicase subunit of the Holliday junction resolvase
LQDFTVALRPNSFDDLVGQEHLSSKNAPLRVLCEKGVLGHSFFMALPVAAKLQLLASLQKSWTCLFTNSTQLL